MKTFLVRTLVLVSLATPFTGLPAIAETKHNDAANVSAAQQQGCAKEEKKQKKERKEQASPTADQEFQRMLMAIYG